MNLERANLRSSLVAALGGLLFGYDTAVISGAVAAIDHDFILPLGLDETLRDVISGLTISSALLGCILGAACAGALADAKGRKFGLIAAAILFLVSALGSAVPEFGLAPFGTTGLPALCAFNLYRVMCGAGIGIASMLSPLYIAEIAPAARRGQLVSLNQMAIVIGIVGVYFVNWAIARQGDEAWIDSIGWRLMLGSEALPAGLFLIALLFVSDTPRWLMMRGRETEAAAVLRILERGRDIAMVLAEIRISLKRVESDRLFAYGGAVVLIGFCLSVFQQLVGINAVLYYAPLMFRNLGATTDSALLQTVIIGAANMLATAIAIFTVDEIGRRRLLMAGAALMAAAMIGLSISFAQKSEGLFALTCVVVYVVAFAMSWGPVVWVVLSEMFPGPIRGKAMSLAVAAQWTANLFVSWSFKVLDGNSTLNLWLNHGFAYLLYGAMSLAALVFVWRFVPETAGMTLESMNDLWTEKAPSPSRASRGSSRAPYIPLDPLP